MGGVSQEIHPQELAGTEQTLSLSQANVPSSLQQAGQGQHCHRIPYGLDWEGH